MTALNPVPFVQQFIAIDDDHATLFMCKVIIQRTFKKMEVKTYHNPLTAIEYFESDFTACPVETIVLLDINMPELSGWEVLDHFKLMHDKVRKFIKVIMLSSSIDPTDKQRAIEHSCVTDYLEKPLTLATLDAVMEKMKTEMCLH